MPCQLMVQAVVAEEQLQRPACSSSASPWLPVAWINSREKNSNYLSIIIIIMIIMTGRRLAAARLFCCSETSIVAK